MRHTETCHCTKRSLEFSSDFEGDVVTKIWCPECISSAPDDALVFELCEPGEFAGVWAVKYNAGELKRLDAAAFRDSDDYFLSLLISGVSGPTLVKTHYRGGGYCRVLGFKHGPTLAASGALLSGKARAAIEDEMPTLTAVDTVPRRRPAPKRGKRGKARSGPPAGRQGPAKKKRR